MKCLSLKGVVWCYLQGFSTRDTSLNLPRGNDRKRLLTVKKNLSRFKKLLVFVSYRSRRRSFWRLYARASSFETKRAEAVSAPLGNSFFANSILLFY